MSTVNSITAKSNPVGDGDSLRVFHWGRSFGDDIAYNKTHTYLAYGIRGAGKSALLESIGEEHLRRGHGVFDLWGARNGEGLAWLRSKWAEEGRVLLLHGDNTSVACSYDTKPVSKYRNSDLEKYDIIVSASPLYSSLGVEFQFTNQLIDRIYNRLHWRKPVYLLVREAANLLYSRAKVVESQKSTKYFLLLTMFSLSLWGILGFPRSTGFSIRFIAHRRCRASTLNIFSCLRGVVVMGLGNSSCRFSWV